MLEDKYALSNLIDYLRSTQSSFQRLCPHCSCKHIVLYGKYNGRQRYKCKDCGRTFGNFTNTPFSMTHFPEKWGTFMNCMLKGMSLRAAAKELKISYITLFYWRHKLLAALKEISPNEMTGIFGLENFYLKYSEKGQKQPSIKKKRIHGKSMGYFNLESDKVCVLTAIDVHENIFFKAICRGHINTKDMENSLGKILNENNIICSRPKPMFATFLKRMHIKESKKASDDTNTVIRYINGYMAWMSRFNGVATKYLNNYLIWYKFLKSISFDETWSGVKRMITTVSDVNIKNTYISIRNAKMYINS